MVSESKIGTQV
ncbi:hypothetical protein D047_2116A, partial [Vibrio parahaemolyticus VPTS-2010_2]